MRLGQTNSQRGTPRVLLAVVLMILLSSVTTGSAFTALYVFGDSLSDTGRNPAPAPDYYDGRYSNGPLWIEYLSAQLGLPYNASNNFAVSGSTTADLQSQIAGLTSSTNLQSGLFSVLSGGNDFLDASPVLGVNDAAWGVVVSNAVLNLTNAVSTLYALGAREVMVGNLAYVGQTPAFLGTPVGYAEYVDSKVALFNARLASALTNLAQLAPGLRIYALDDNLAFANLLSSPAKYGLTVTTNGALEDPNLTDKSFTGPGADYVFWDVVHPTTKVDALTAAGAFQSVSPQLNLPRNSAESNLMVVNLYPGLPYAIQTSTNLVTWSDYQTITPAGTNAIVGWTNGSASQFFYRVKY